MARPGRRRGWIVITTAPEMRIGAETVTPATVVLLDTRWNGDARPIATAMIIAIQHRPQDDPVTEAGSGVQRPERQLLPVLVTVIQRVSRGLHGGLVLRTEHIVQWPSRQPHSCEGARPPAMLICLVIRDRHSRCMTWVVDVVQQIFRPGLGSIHFFQFNSIPIQVGFRIFQFNFNSNRIQNLSIQFQFNSFSFNSNSIQILSIIINQSNPVLLKNAPCRRRSHALRSAPVSRGRLLSTVLHRWSPRHSILSAGLR